MRYKRRADYKSGIYRPINCQKFGAVKCQYRSSWEHDFLRWADYNDKITKVLYEKIIVPYICKTDGKMHRYYVDCAIEMKEGKETKKWLVEIKPFRQTIPPKESKKKKPVTIITEKLNWVKNQSKWDSAKKYCRKMGYRWCIITEKGIYLDDKFHELKIFGKNV